jgi:hypothetical protein
LKRSSKKSHNSLNSVLVALGIVLLILGACAVMIPPVSPSQAEWAAHQWPGMDFTQLDNARTLYVNRCSGCHNLYLPKDHTLPEWNKVMDRMAPKAKLSAVERDIIQRYITAAHESPN